MPQSRFNENTLDWIFRVMLAIGIYIICNGYFSWFQVKNQLVSPLIPESTVNLIFRDGNDLLFKASLWSSIWFLGGTWAYTFKKKKLSILLLMMVPVTYLLITSFA